MPWDFIGAMFNLTELIISVSERIMERQDVKAIKDLQDRLEEIARINEEARRKSQQIVLTATLFTFTVGIVGAGIFFKWVTRKPSG